nr:peptidase inhibitor family I36 protein [Streptomyces typhae]
MAASVPLTTETSVTATEDYPVRKIWGKGTAACPEKSICLYQDSNYNEDSHEGRGRWIWVVTGPTARIPGGNDEASSLHANLEGTPWETAAFCEDTNFQGGTLLYLVDGASRPNLKRVGGHQVNLNDMISSVNLLAGDWRRPCSA